MRSERGRHVRIPVAAMRSEVEDAGRKYVPDLEGLVPGGSRRPGCVCRIWVEGA